MGVTYKARGCKVISNDIQFYSYVLNKHYIENCLPMNDEFTDMLNSLQGRQGFIYNNFALAQVREEITFPIVMVRSVMI